MKIEARTKDVARHNLTLSYAELKRLQKYTYHRAVLENESASSLEVQNS